MNDRTLEKYLNNNYEIYDRFTFDRVFRFLLKYGYDEEEAKDIILHNCALSALVLQERIHNVYYHRIHKNEGISKDLLEYMNEDAKRFMNLTGTELLRFSNSVKNNTDIKPHLWKKGGPKKDGFVNVILIIKIHFIHQSLKLVARFNRFSLSTQKRKFPTRTDWEDSKKMALRNRLVCLHSQQDEKNIGTTTIYGQLEDALGVRIEPVPDEWDRLYNVDFFIKVEEKYIGLQIKPISSGMALNQYQWIKVHEENHKRFRDRFGGRVFLIYSIKAGKKKKIFNIKVIEKIKKEIRKLQK